MISCKDCKHFETSENHAAHLGWCELKLPPWLYKAVNVDEWEVTRTVRVDDTCSFAKEVE